FVDRHTLEVTRYGTTARRLTADVFLVATGACPAPPVGYTLDDEVVVDSDSLLMLQRMPSSMIVVGGGVIGCEYACTFAALGVRINARSFVQIDANHRTAVPNIYAAGDVVGFPGLASTGMEQARVAVCHAFDLRYKRAVSSVLPYTVWTIPELATVGESEE